MNCKFNPLQSTTMKQLHLILPLFFIFNNVVHASVTHYSGTWNNTTFQASGNAHLVINTDTVVPGEWELTFDLDGDVFFIADPAPEIFTIPDLSLPGTIEDTFSGGFYGDINLKYESSQLTITGTNLPAEQGEFIIQTDLSGSFTPTSTSFIFDYIVWFDGSNPAAGIFGNSEFINYALGDIQLTKVDEVPLPSGIVLMLTALTGLAAFSRRKHPIISIFAE